MNLTKELKLAYIQNQDFLLTAIQADKMLLKNKATMEEIIPALNSIDSRGLKNLFLNKNKCLEKVKESTNRALRALAKKGDTYYIGAYIFFSQKFITDSIIYFLEKRNFEVMNTFCKSLSSQHSSCKKEYFSLNDKLVNYFNNIILNDPKNPTSKAQTAYAVRCLSNLFDIFNYYITKKIKKLPSFKPFIEKNMNRDIAVACFNHSCFKEKRLGYPKDYFLKKLRKYGRLKDYVEQHIVYRSNPIVSILEELKNYNSDEEIRETIEFIFGMENFKKEAPLPIALELLKIYILANGDIYKLKNKSLTKNIINKLLEFSSVASNLNFKSEESK